MPIDCTALAKGLIFILLALHDYGYSQANRCFFDIFDKGVFGFVSIKLIVFFIMATIFIMVMFNFQF